MLSSSTFSGRFSTSIVSVLLCRAARFSIEAAEAKATKKEKAIENCMMIGMVRCGGLSSAQKQLIENELIKNSLLKGKTASSLYTIECPYNTHLKLVVCIIGSSFQPCKCCAADDHPALLGRN